MASARPKVILATATSLAAGALQEKYRDWLPASGFFGMADDEQGSTIVIADDDLGLVRLIARVLKREGYEVVSFDSGFELIRWRATHHADLLLLDLRLHDIEGKELIATLADAGQSLPFIIITGQGDERTAVDMMRRGAVDYLIKDVDFLQFVPAVVKRALTLKKQARKLAAAEQQARLSQSAIEQGDTGVLITSGDALDPEMVYVNAAFLKLADCSLEQLMGKPLSHLEALTGRWSSFRRALSSGRPITNQMQVLGRRNRRRITECAISPVTDSSGKRTHWTVLLRDITERLGFERVLRLQRDMAFVLARAGSSEEIAPKILQAVNQAFNWKLGELWSVDEEARLFRLVSSWPGPVSPSSLMRAPTLPLSAEAGLPGRVWATDTHVFLPNLSIQTNGSGRGVAEMQGLRTAMGFPISWRGKVLGAAVFFGSELRPLDPGTPAFFLAIGSQIAQFLERKRAEAALRRSEANLASAQQIAHVGSFEISLTSLNDIHWSVELYRILGLDPSEKPLPPMEFLGRLVHPHDRARVSDSLNRCLKQRSRIDLEYRVVRPDGAMRHLHSLAEPVLGVGNKVVKLVGVTHDITERKQLEQTVWETSEREQRRFGLDLHDGLGQQLTGIELLCESLKGDLDHSQPDLSRQAAEMCGLLREAIRETRSLAHGLAAFKVQSSGLQAALMELAWTTSLSGRVVCQARCPAADLKDAAVATHFYRIAQEAVSNAVKHGGATKVQISLSRSNGHLRLQIRDNGRGIARKKKSSQGMGLMVMKHRASMLGAELQFRSLPGKGVTVTCTMPGKA